MFLPRLRVALVPALTAAAVAGSLGAAALPASAAASRPAAAGEIRCYGDVCIQTVSVSTNIGATVVNAWADTQSFRGFFEENNTDGIEWAGPVGTWQAGGKPYQVHVTCNTNWTYVIGAFTKPGGKFLGGVTFGINRC